ncbi:MAG: hypothetical protein ACFFG0_14180, partial [Candidatus Thorarchaeota archaeon]
MALEFNGNNNSINLGDVTQLNGASTATICFWMVQDVLDVQDNIFVKYKDSNEVLYTQTQADGSVWFLVYNGDAAKG